MGPSATRSRRSTRDRDTLVLVDTTMSRDPITEEVDGISEGVGQHTTSPKFVLPMHEKRTFRKNREAVRSLARASNSSSNTNPNATTSESTQRHGVRAKAKPGSCRPKIGDDPFIVMFDEKGAICDQSHKFDAYCGEEAWTYDRYPLHLEWDAQQMTHVNAFYEAAQHEHYKFVGAHGKEFCQIEAKSAIKRSIQHKKREHRSEIKYNYFRRWEAADPMTRECMLEDIGKLMPRVQWPSLIEYWNSPKKKAQSERNTVNRKKPRATSTQGSITIINKDHKMKKKLGNEYTPAKLWLETHNANDEDTMTFRKKFEDTVETLKFTENSDLTVLTPVLDSIYGKHHGGYERGIGEVYRRRNVIDSSTYSQIFRGREDELVQMEKRLQVQIHAKLDAQVQATLDAEREDIRRQAREDMQQEMQVQVQDQVRTMVNVQREVMRQEFVELLSGRPREF